METWVKDSSGRDVTDFLDDTSISSGRKQVWGQRVCAPPAVSPVVSSMCAVVLEVYAYVRGYALCYGVM